MKYSACDVLDFYHKVGTSVVINAANQLLLTNAGNVLSTLGLSGSYKDNTFTIQADGMGGVLVVVNAPQPKTAAINYHAVNGQLSLADSPLTISNLVEGSSQIELSKAIFTAFAGATVVTIANFSNTPSSTGGMNYLYYNAKNGGLYYDADATGSHSSGVEIAVIGVDSHPTALSVADFKLIA